MSDPVIIEPKSGKAADACVIILHGLGANGHDFEPLVPALNLPSEMNVRFIMPHALNLPVTVNGGMVMPAWYDILEMNLGRKVDSQQLRDSAKRIQSIIDEQIAAGIASERIIVAGFSQGGAVAYETALSYPHALGGLLVLSSYFATQADIQLSEANKPITIEVHHGVADPVVPESLGVEGVKACEAFGYKVNYRHYDMGHTLCPEQAQDISRWIVERLQG